jgi:hypothetical protein
MDRLTRSGQQDARQVPRFSYNSNVAKLRVLLDENLSRDLAKAFARKIPVYTVAALGLSGAGDPRIIEEAVYKKCLIVTADRKFMDVYRNHEWRKGHDGRYFYGLIFLTEDKTTGQLRQLRLATPKITPEHDDLITVSSSGTIAVENLGRREN